MVSGLGLYRDYSGDCYKGDTRRLDYSSYELVEGEGEGAI